MAVAAPHLGLRPQPSTPVLRLVPAPARRSAAERATYRRRRVVAALAAAALTATLGLATIGGQALGAGAVPAADHAVVVADGDTVWGLARAHAPEGASTAAYVLEILEHNPALDPGSLRPGAVVHLPAG